MLEMFVDDDILIETIREDFGEDYDRWDGTGKCKCLDWHDGNAFDDVVAVLVSDVSDMRDAHKVAEDLIRRLPIGEVLDGHGLYCAARASVCRAKHLSES